MTASDDFDHGVLDRRSSDDRADYARLDHPNSAPVLTYRLATEADLPIIKEYYTLLNRHFYSLGYHLPHPENVGDVYLESFRRTLGKFSNAWVAEVDGQVKAYLLVRIKRVPQYMGGVLVGELSDEWVEPDVRRLRIGDRLCRLGLEWLREQGVHSVEIQVLTNNDASWKMLSRMGFKQEFRVGRLLWDEYVSSDALDRSDDRADYARLDHDALDRRSSDVLDRSE